MADEILAHISAPATRQHDNLYRSLLLAYHDFAPYKSHRERSEELLEELKLPLNCEESPSEPPNRGILVDIPGNTSIISTSKESYGSFPSHNSSEDHASYHENVPRLSHNSFLPKDTTPVSSRLAQLEHIHQTWKVRAASKSSLAKRQGVSGQIPPSLDSLETTFIEDTQLAAQIVQSQLQDTYSVTSEDSEVESNLEEDFVSETHHIRNDDLQSSHVGRLPRFSLPNKTYESKVPFTVSNTSSRDTSFMSTDHSPEAVQARLIDLDSVATQVDFASLLFDAFPPAPKISVEQPLALPSQITKHLAAIKAQNTSVFQPARTSRALDDDDRGHWLVKCSSWPTKLQYEFWKALCEHVTSGRLGWGVTLHREGQVHTSLGAVRLYCWGEVIEHMWLLIWLCSSGKVVGSGSQWFDGDGIAVIEVA
ncbi:hypothetical protein ACN47E_003045 [Coniothyrium glycines]